MAVVIVTGMSGRGKSGVLAELARRGHRVVDTAEIDTRAPLAEVVRKLERIAEEIAEPLS